ncbi:MAG TPA: adenylate/guanylate cyclase domain-containing protein [Alphaproteobacteria bacterium]|nr:adenylate/guanylate cyclase domain-containing protein [Alphaproteobacteria bacterium]
MRILPRIRHVLIASAITLAVSIGVAATAPSRLAGLSVDLLYWLRDRIVPVRSDPSASPTAVVAIDEETYHTPPFINYPTVLWTRELAGMLDALVAADARVVGFDIVFPASIEPYVPGFDRDFLIALHNAAAKGKVVLGEVQHQKWPIHPFASQAFAVGGVKNIRSVNLFSDDDGVIRRVPLTFQRVDPNGGTHSEPSLPLELASRAQGVEPAPQPGGGWALGRYRIPGSSQNTMMLNFANRDAIPTYSFADLQACAAKGDTEFFRKHFAGKVVLVGGVLDIEDRKLTSLRFVMEPERVSTGERCVHPPMTELFRADLVRDTIPGVMVLAAAVNNLLDGNVLREIGPRAAIGFVLLLAFGCAAAMMLLRPLAGGSVLFVVSAVWTAVALAVFRGGLALPLVAPPLAAALSCALLLGYRFAVTDRDKRLVRNSFKLYLAPAVVDRMLDADRLPELGGEMRKVTVFFSDLAGFATLSEGISPQELVALMNEYLTAMTDIIEAEGGFVDKYIGDAILAIFGAPLDDAQHELHAVRAALRCRDRLEELNRDPSAFRGKELKARIGLGTGEMIVGNIGSRRRFNYTVMGDMVNLTARLEGANKIYGTAILSTTATRDAAGDGIEWREIDRVRVVGRQQPESVFEPVALKGEMTDLQGELNAVFATALAEYRARRFETAVRLFEALASRDPASKVFAERARRWHANPPPEAWDAVTTLETK